MAKEEEDNNVYSITPKGVMLVALGGYGDNSARKKAQQVHDSLIDYMKRNDVAIVYFDDQLTFTQFEIKTETDGKK